MESCRRGQFLARVLKCHAPAHAENRGGKPRSPLSVKTARFAALVKSAGSPSVHLTWSAPAHDPVLRRALHQNRLVTVHQRARGGKDFASVGLEPERHAQFLIFPRSVRSFSQHRIVGVNYDLLETALSAGPLPKSLKRKRLASTTRSAATGATKEPRSMAANSVPVSLDAPPQKVAAAAPIAPAPPADPVLREVWRAVQDLRKGRHRVAQKRLQELLDRGAPPN